jgi:hypothetical protein
MLGQIHVNVDGVPIKINFKIFKILRADKFPELVFFEKGTSVQKPTIQKTLFANHLLHKIDTENLELQSTRHGITELEVTQTRKFVDLFEDMYQLLVFNTEIFADIHKNKMVRFRDYVETLKFDEGPLTTLDESITTLNALKKSMFTGPITLHENNIKFKLQQLNQWELEAIFDIIKSFTMKKPTKKQFICSLNKILIYEFNDYSNKKFSRDPRIMIQNTDIMPIEIDMYDLIIDRVSKNHYQIRDTLKSKYLYYYVVKKLGRIEVANFWTDDVIPNDTQYYRTYWVALARVLIHIIYNYINHLNPNQNYLFLIFSCTDNLQRNYLSAGAIYLKKLLVSSCVWHKEI